MKDGATKGFQQAYHAQAAGDRTAQIIVAATLTQESNDKHQLVPVLEQLEENCGWLPAQVSADAGYCTTEQVTGEKLRDADLHVPPGPTKARGAASETISAVAPAEASMAEQMRHKRRSAAGQAAYQWRKAIVEPVFGQTKEARGFRRFSFRAPTKVAAE